MSLDHVAVYYTTDGAEPRGACGQSPVQTVLARPSHIARDAISGLRARHWQATLPGQPEGTLVRYRAQGWRARDQHRCWQADGATDPEDIPSPGGQLFAYAVDRRRPPAWLADAIIYHIFVDRFASGAAEPAMHDPGAVTGIFGGTLRGVLEHLDYIAALGANCIWLSPVTESPTAHGYNPSDYYHVARRLGTNKTLMTLIRSAHQRNIRVVLDFVANHTSDQHPLFQQARAPSPRPNPAANWYAFGPRWPHGYATFARQPDMPVLNTQRAEVQRYLSQVALHWLGEFGADGLRLDDVPGPSHAFWTQFQSTLKQSYPDAVTLGEIMAPPSEIASYAGRMDAFLDFPLCEMLRRVFAKREAPLDALLTFLSARRMHLPSAMDHATFLDNHDMNRFVWLAGENRNRLKLAAACHLTLEGTPIVYYGTEVGLSQRDDARKEFFNARAPMLWGTRQDQALLAHYQRLIALRAAHPALRRGAWARVPIGATRATRATRLQVGGYVRWLSGECLLVALNNTPRPVSAALALRKVTERTGVAIAARSHPRNLIAPDAGAPITHEDGVLSLDLPASGAAVVQLV